MLRKEQRFHPILYIAPLVILSLLCICLLTYCLVPLFVSGQACFDIASGHIPPQAEQRFLRRVFDAIMAEDYDWLITVSSKDITDELKSIRPRVTKDYEIIGSDDLAGMYENDIRFSNGAIVHVTLLGSWPCPDFQITEQEIFSNIKLSEVNLKDVSSPPAVVRLNLDMVRSLDWSLDDNRLLITGIYTNEQQLVIFDWVTNERQVLFAQTGDLTRAGWLNRAKWSPSGKKVVFTIFHSPENSRGLKSGVWVLEVDSRNVQLLTDRDGAGAFSSDSSQVFLTQPASIDRMNLLTGQQETFQIDEGDSTLNTGSLAVSPDGRLLAVSAWLLNDSSVDASTSPSLYILDLDSGKSHRLSALDGVSPSWSPDGEMLAFLGRTKKGEAEGLYLINADGTCPTLIFDLPREWSYSPVWSHDGSKIAFIYSGTVYMANVDALIKDRKLLNRLSCP